MYQAFTAEQTRGIEQRVIRARGTDIRDLMREVGAAVAVEAARIAPGGRIVILAGAGNNAGDGWVAAHRLHESGRDAYVCFVDDPDTLPEPARSEALDARASGLPSRPIGPGDVADALDGAALVVDALFGFGLRGALRDPHAGIVRELNALGLPVVAVDLPSGVEADTGAAVGEAVRAGRTLAVLVPKVGHVQEPGRSYAGVVQVLGLGTDQGLLHAEGGIEVWDVDDIASALPTPRPADHKGSRGRVLVVGGSPGMSGAVVLAGWGALRTGAGYVVLAVPDSLVDVVDAGAVPAVVRGLPETDERSLDPRALSALLDEAGAADAVVLGCGLGRGSGATPLVEAFLAACPAPVVLDADGLNALGALGATDVLRSRSAPTILTPHPGEAGRLLDVGTTDIQADRVGAARAIADHGVTVVLKGAGTVVASGSRLAAVPTGTPALATLGTGDVLAGAIGSLLAQGVAPFEASYIAAYLHGLAWERAAADLTDPGTTAIDVAHALAQVRRDVSASDR